MLCGGAQIDTSFVRLLLPQLRPADVVQPVEETLELKPAIEEVERKLILRALGAAGNNKAQAARLLGISERTLWYKLKRPGCSAPCNRSVR
ncbi:MAG TPA: helix-turn-helix domain-containing protein [Candidatus Acidoferrales bacterium]|nr:helix-turn-helix domain-containing protein [Candidatus Acidoferrales bacterium]